MVDEGHESRIYELTGPQSLLPAEQLAVLARVLGRDLRAIELTDEETRAELEADMPVEYVNAFVSFYVDGTLDESEVQPDVTDVTHRPARTFEQWAQAHAEQFVSSDRRS